MARHKSAQLTNRPTLKDIDFGEDDANIEYEISSHTSKSPIFVRAFFDHPQLNLNDLETGRRYFVLGQKGTGKTAVLRKIEQETKDNGGITKFVVFRDEIASREELDRLGSVFAIPVNDVKKTYHHLYTLERLILLMICASIKGADTAVSDDDVADEPGFRETIKRVIGQPLRKIAETAFDTAKTIYESVSIDPSALSKGTLSVDASHLLMKSNERLFDLCERLLEKAQNPVFIFIDEIHFTYRFGADHDQDAALVRDLIRAVARVNRNIAEKRLKARIYAAIRSEYVEHPLISAAELHPTLTGFGSEISWATFNADFKHPMFEIGARRVEASTGVKKSGAQFMKACFANFRDDDAAEFVQSTWSKPRDMIRFLRTCKIMFPDRVTLSMPQYKQAFHQSCLSSRKEIETALSSFLTTKGLEAVMNLVSQSSSRSLEKGYAYSQQEFFKSLTPIVKNETQVGSINLPETLFRILYMLGAVYTYRTRTGLPPIVHSFHRGNPNPDPDGAVAIHRGLAKSFS